ncbi:uncharacterized protein LOC127807380 [Diospyros lotus]|uniref:uncharacterized protein LOC127807380 n=1 Tax=Diospyros lotus TaxID=55363 RepID=UPI0022506195|nr:uncharacterized protein LOC127807380 [Diospyros lotus]
MAAAYLNDIVDAWYQNWKQAEGPWVSWRTFAEELCGRFGEKNMTDMVEEFNKLRQQGSIEDYLRRFEELRAVIGIAHPSLSETYFVSSFISGLKDDMRSVVKMLAPATVKQAAEKARLQELTWEAVFKKGRTWNHVGAQQGRGISFPSGEYSKSTMGVSGQGGPRTSNNSRSNKNSTMEQRRQLGLCFKCGEKYGPGHQCRRLMLKMEGSGEDDEAEEELLEEVVEGEGREQEDYEDEGGQISFHALKGGSTGRIIQVKGQVGKKRLAVLIDSGSTHSFLNKAIAVDLNCKMTETVPLSVTVANGNKMYSHHKCYNFNWVMQGVEFMADFRVLELRGCDVVLRVDWMKTISPLTFDFNKLEVTVEVEGRKLTLVGNLEQGECKLISGKRLQKLIQKNSGQITHLYSLRGMEEEDQATNVEAELKLLMNEVLVNQMLLLSSIT